uniref:Putative secreted protein n=1 Tax=Anopheles darlingi TaxID=43151 RepID=A0A2M4D7U9_ANODA
MTLSSVVTFTWYVSSTISSAFCQLLMSSWDRCATRSCTSTATLDRAAMAAHGFDTQTHGFLVSSGCKCPSGHRKLYSDELASAGNPPNPK